MGYVNECANIIVHILNFGQMKIDILNLKERGKTTLENKI